MGADDHIPKSAQPRPGVADKALQLDAEDLRAITARLRRAQGQLAGIAVMLEEGRNCRDIVYQLAAAKKAVERSGYALFEAALRQCISDPASAPDDAKAMQRLFLSLS